MASNADMFIMMITRTFHLSIADAAAIIITSGKKGALDNLSEIADFTIMTLVGPKLK